MAGCRKWLWELPGNRDAARASYLNGQDIPVDGGFSSHGGAKSITDALSRAHPGIW
jgi:hypothetical protein